MQNKTDAKTDTLKPCKKDPHRKLGSFAETLPEDRERLRDLIDEAYAAF